MTAEQRRTTIGRWCEAGLAWRSWTVRETTAVLYRQLVADLYQSGQKNVLREFLKLAGDTDSLAALDREAMGQTSGIEVSDTPRLRGQHGG